MKYNLNDAETLYNKVLTILNTHFECVDDYYIERATKNIVSIVIQQLKEINDKTHCK